MGIKIKYDPVGSLFLGSFQSGVQEDLERRRIEWERQRMQTAQMLQNASVRNATQLNRNLVNVGPAAAVPIPALPAPGGSTLSARRAARKATHAAEMERRKVAFETGMQARADAYKMGNAAPAANMDAAPVANEPPVDLEMPKPRLPAASVGPDGNVYVDKGELEDYLRGVKETVDEKIPEEELENMDSAVMREYNEHANQVRQILRGRTALDTNNPETHQVIERLMANMEGIRNAARKAAKQSASTVQDQVAQENEAVAQQEAQQVADQAAVGAVVSEEEQRQKFREENRKKAERIAAMGRERRAKARTSDKSMTPEQKEQREQEEDAAELAELKLEEARERKSMQTQLDALNIRIAEGKTPLTAAEEAKRNMLIASLSEDDPAFDANQQIVDRIMEEEQIRARYGIAGPIGDNMRAYHAWKMQREQAAQQANDDMYAPFAQHTAGALSGLPVTGPDGRRYKAGTEFERREDGSIIYRPDGFPMVKRPEKPQKPLGKVGSQHWTPSTKETGDIELPPSMPEGGWLSGYGLDPTEQRRNMGFDRPTPQAPRRLGVDVKPEDVKPGERVVAPDGTIRVKPPETPAASKAAPAAPSKPQGKVKMVHSQKEVDELPLGWQYMLPNGKMKTKRQGDKFPTDKKLGR